MAYAHPLAFPAHEPEGFPILGDEPVFDPAVHLALEMPTEVISLQELGYSDGEIAACPSNLGITSCFRILSDAGVDCLVDIARRLEPYARSVERISRMVRGGAYQSRFLRDLCQSPEVTAALSEIASTALLPHSIPHQLGHLNYNPHAVGENVDKWHVDTLRFDYVMFVTDPNAIAGGEFEYFRGTAQEMKQLKQQGQALPAERIIAPELPGPGYAVLQQGNMVVHRAKGLASAGERITMVNGYVPGEIGVPDYTRFDQLFLADPAHVAASEFARHVAWMGAEMLRHDIETAEFNSDREKLADRLAAVGQLLNGAAAEIRNADAATMEHFGD